MNERKETTKILIKFLKKRYEKKLRRKIEKVGPFELLITTILSQRTRDENTNKASSSLFSRVKTPHDILKLRRSELEKLIKSAGMYKQKAERIRKVSKILIEKYGGKVPKTREELLSLPGVGFKTADIVLSYGFGIPTIAIDTHCNRISKRLGLVDERADVEEVRKTLESLVPERDRFIVNMGLVNFGREICLPLRPRCKICPMRKYCKYYSFKVCQQKTSKCE